jgi:hypothetical protein
VADPLIPPRYWRQLRAFLRTERGSGTIKLDAKDGRIVDVRFPEPGVVDSARTGAADRASDTVPIPALGGHDGSAVAP